PGERGRSPLARDPGGRAVRGNRNRHRARYSGRCVMTSVRSVAVLIAITGLGGGSRAAAQHAPGEERSANVHLLSHIPLGGQYRTGDIEVEQELSRPYVYVSRIYTDAGFDVISVKDPARASRIYSWRIENPELHIGAGGSDGHYFKYQGRYYYVESVQVRQSGPDGDLGAVVFDVSGLPDTIKVKAVAGIRFAEAPVGFH